MSTNLPPEIDRLIQQEFAHGRYGSEEELLLEAIRLLGQRDRLRAEVEAGTQQLATGQYTAYDPAALRKRFDELKAGRSFRGGQDD